LRLASRHTTWVAAAASLIFLLGTVPADAAAGDLNCGEALVCLLTCEQNDAQCMYNCGQGLHPKAEDLFGELLMCLAPVCAGSPPDPVCLLQHSIGKCKGPYEACLNDGGCVPSCDGKDCGDDGCAGSCGSCPAGLTCKEDFTCGPCDPDCSGKQCGDDGCGGSCGECSDGNACIDFQCLSCNPDCSGKQCGDDGCGGSCGTCGFQAQCQDGQCITCTPNCSGKECGDNGCGGMCGSCPANFQCEAGVCVEKVECKPNCLNRECGDNGCGGTCGSCGGGQVCSATGVCGEPGEDQGAPVVETVDAIGGGEEVSQDVTEYTPSVDTRGNNNGNQCPPGQKKVFGQCVPDEDGGGGGGGGGCSASATPGVATPVLVVFLLALLLRRIRTHSMW